MSPNWGLNVWVSCQQASYTSLLHGEKLFRPLFLFALCSVLEGINSTLDECQQIRSHWRVGNGPVPSVPPSQIRTTPISVRRPLRAPYPALRQRHLCCFLSPRCSSLFRFSSCLTSDWESTRTAVNFNDWARGSEHSYLCESRTPHRSKPPENHAFSLALLSHPRERAQREPQCSKYEFWTPIYFVDVILSCPFTEMHVEIIAPSFSSFS